MNHCCWNVRRFVIATLCVSLLGSAASTSAAIPPTAILPGIVMQVVQDTGGVVTVDSPPKSTEPASDAAAAKPDVPSTKSSATSATKPAAAAGNQGGLSLGWAQLRELFLGLSGLPMWALVGCSVMTIMFVVERFISLQSRRVMPRAFVSRFLGQLREGDLDRAKVQELVQVCRDNDCPIAHFFAIVVENAGRPAFEIRVTISDLADSELFHLRKNIRAISGLAMLAPLLGLFGTVLGMISAFHALSQQSGSGKTELLASGISLALVATASGLGVAISASAAYYYLLGRVDTLIQEMDVLTNQAVALVASDGRPRDLEKKPRKAPSDSKSA